MMSKKDNINAKYKRLGYDFLKPYMEKPDPFTTEVGKVVYYRTYSRDVPEENRREFWWETVARVVEFSAELEKQAMQKQGLVVDANEEDRLNNIAKQMFEYMYNLQLFPSGRTLWIGGSESAFKNPLSNFNCSFVAIDDLEKFSEMFLVLMLGTGVGLSVEKQYIDKLPKINNNIHIIHKEYNGVSPKERTEHTQLIENSKDIVEIIIGDSKHGWSQAMKMYLNIISSKNYDDIKYITFNYDNIRPIGEPLLTFGGTASGHEAIKTMFSKIDKMLKKQGNGWIKLKPINALDIATSIAENVVSGGVRRSALIVFCDPTDTEVINAKTNLYTQTDGVWEVNDEIVHRQLSNNTIIYNDKPTRKQLHEQFKSMRYSGEPGFANMTAMKERRADAQGGNPLTTFK